MTFNPELTNQISSTCPFTMTVTASKHNRIPCTQFSYCIKKKKTKEQNPLYTVWASKSYDDSKNEAAKSHSLYMHDP